MTDQPVLLRARVLVTKDGQPFQLEVASADGTKHSVCPKLEDVVPDSALSFEAFSRINRLRCESPEGFNHALSSWSTSDWFTALLGELGEAANVAKKLNRVRDGIPGNKNNAGELRAKLRQELGDTFVYLDLLCQSLGVSIGQAAVEVFNAKSNELNCPIVIATSLPVREDQQPPVQALRKLVAKWRDPNVEQIIRGTPRSVYKRCADDLESLLEQTPP